MLLIGAAASGGSAAPSPTAPPPSIPPGYRPVIEKDERGVWMEMQEYEAALGRSPLLVRDPELNDYVQTAMCRVAGPYCADVRVYLIRNPGFNASMAPNGMMQVWTGLLLRVASEDELASVLGHELAHYLRTDSIERFRRVRDRMSTGSVLSFGLAIATGVYLPVGEAGAMLSVLAFSREQERNADLLGARLMADAGYDPHASYRIWEALMEEERRAESKAEEPGPFMSTHPASEQRSQTLRDWVESTYGPPPIEATARQDEHRRLLEANYMSMMGDQLRTNRYGRSEVMLERHEALGIDPGLVAYFRGRMYVQRGNAGDAALARDAFSASASTGSAPPEAFRDLGYLLVKAGDMPGARAQFSRYLDAQPEAADRSMIEYYLNEE